jgi:hypothetical protein
MLSAIFQSLFSFILSTIALIYPAYSTYQAIYVYNNTGDKQLLQRSLLTWLLLTPLLCMEQLPLISLQLYFPTYYAAFKCSLLLFLSSDNLNVAEKLYRHYLEPIVSNNEACIESSLNQLQAKAGLIAAELQSQSFRQIRKHSANLVNKSQQILINSLANNVSAAST